MSNTPHPVLKMLHHPRQKHAIDVVGAQRVARVAEVLHEEHRFHTRNAIKEWERCYHCQLRAFLAIHAFIETAGDAQLNSALLDLLLLAREMLGSEWDAFAQRIMALARDEITEQSAP